MDLWRWYVYENENSPETWNTYWWQLNYEFLGISPPTGYTTEGLDATGKYHVMENIPYIRYFLASFLQLQFFEALCEDYENIHDCQLRGNKKAGARLWRMMEKGSSEHWSVVLKEMTGFSEILSKPLLRYFEPVRSWLEAEVRKNNLTVGW
ncbi:unnamed protein product [Allacma fusca]|uniref:Angiotensin-converting enzyme n=1 Tax=Allacma fusca TaxID=39272 RepID=A0A8J2JC04_9HEXA|nr:unnamed protein product [Allacma fusca]